MDFGAGSKLLRGTVTLEGTGGATRLAPLGASLEGTAAFRAGWSSFPKAEPVGGGQHVNYIFMKNGWTSCHLQLPTNPALELDLSKWPLSTWPLSKWP